MADDEDTIYVDVAAKLDEGEAEKASSKLRDKFKGVGQKISDTVSSELSTDLPGKISDVLSDAGHKGVDALSDVFKSGSGGLGSVFDDLGDKLGGSLGKTIGGAVGDALKDIPGVDAAVGSMQHIGDKAKDVKTQVEGIASTFKDLPGIIGRVGGAISELAGPIAIAVSGALELRDALDKIPAIHDNFFDENGVPRSGIERRLDTLPGLGPIIRGLTGDKLPPSGPAPDPGVLGPSGDPRAAAPPPDILGGAGGFDPGNLSRRGKVGTRSAFTGGSGVTLVDKVSPSGGGTVPLIQRPDGTWTSSDPSWAHLIQRESGGNPTVPNLYDSNAQAGDPSRGLFQFTQATWLRSGGGKYAQRADLATPQQQAEIAANLIRSNPSGSDWGAGMSGRESASGLLGGLTASPAGFGSGGGGGSNFYQDWYPVGGGAPASPPSLGRSGGGIPGGGMGPLPPPTQGNQPGQGGSGGMSAPQIGQGKGGGLSGGGIIGAAEQAGVAAAGIAGFGGGAIAAQMAEQEINLAIQKGTQLGAAAAVAPLETLWLQGGQMGAPTLQSPAFGWPGKVLGSVIGSQTNAPNVAGQTQPPKQPDQKDQQQDPAGGQQGQGPTGHADDPIHTKSTDPPQGAPQGTQTSAANYAAAAALTTV